MTITITPSHIKTAIIVILAAVVAILLFRPTGCGKGGTITRGTADSTIYWRNKHDQVVASQKALAEQFSVQDARISHLLDSVARVYDTKSRNIQELVIATNKGLSRLKPSTRVEIDVDTVNVPGNCPPRVLRMRQQFKSPYYLAFVQLGDSSYLDLHSIDTLTYLWKTVREGGLFNRKSYLQLDVTHANPDITITGLTSFRRLEKVKQLSMGPETKVMFIDGAVRPLAGIAFTREANRVSVSVSAGKDFTGSTNLRTAGWYGEARAYFKLIKW
jgi:hypothetical protein